MNFRTEIFPASFDKKLNYPDEVIFLGSCFSSAMGEKMAESKFSVSINPFGTVYNPLSISYLLNFSVGVQKYRPEQAICRESSWFSLDCATNLHGNAPENLEEKFIKAEKMLDSRIRTAKALFVSLGTARVHRYLPSGLLVANRQKLPENQFVREWLTPEETAAALKESFGLIKSINPDLQIIITVSPVRHSAEGMEMNAISKSILRYACHLICKDSPEVKYFPAYELLLDDLRDYGFYASDLVHPSQRAEQYIWGKFVDASFSPDAKATLKEWESVQSAMNHKPFLPESESRKALIHQLISRLEKLKNKMNVDAEILRLKTEL